MQTLRASLKGANTPVESVTRQGPVATRMDLKGGVATVLRMTTPASGVPIQLCVLSVVIARSLMTERKSDGDAKPLQSVLILMSGMVAALPVFVAKPRRTSELRPVDEKRNEIERKKRLPGWMTMSPMRLPRTLFSEFRAMGWTSYNAGSKRRERRKCEKTRKPQRSQLFLHPQNPHPHSSIHTHLPLPQRMDTLPLCQHRLKIHLLA